MQVLSVNGVNFSDIIAWDNYNFIIEDLHADGSGRNPLDGLMEFAIIGTKRRVNVTIPPDYRTHDRFRQFISAISANGRVNTYTAYNTVTGNMDTFTGYVNKREANLIGRRRNGAMWIRPAQINIIEL